MGIVGQDYKKSLIIILKNNYIIYLKNIKRSEKGTSLHSLKENNILYKN